MNVKAQWQYIYPCLGWPCHVFTVYREFSKSKLNKCSAAEKVLESPLSLCVEDRTSLVRVSL